MSLDLKVWNRETYSMLDWLGDLGGLFDSLKYIASAFVLPASGFAINATLLGQFFRETPKNLRSEDDETVGYEDDDPQLKKQKKLKRMTK